MSDLTAMTLAQARDALKRKDVSASELAEAHLSAMESARSLNAYVLETPEHARAMAIASDARLRAGDARPLEGIPLGIKDLFATRDVRTTACSRILDNFVPTYESSVVLAPIQCVMAVVLFGKLNNDEFAMGSCRTSSSFGPGHCHGAGRDPTPRSCPGVHPAVRPLPSPRGCAWARLARIPAARSGSPPR